MSALLRIALVCSLTLLSGYALAAEEVPVPVLEHHVTDLTGSLNAGEQAALETKLAQFEQAKGSQIAVLLVPTTRPEEIEQYSIRVVDAWKLGRKKVDDGVLILVAKNDHRMRIEVGYGLEGTIPDAYAKRIIAESIAPLFKQGDIAGGLNAGVDKIIGLVSGEALPPPVAHRAPGQNQFEQLLPILLIGGLLLGAVFRAIFGSFFGGAATGGVIGFLVMLLGGGLIFAIVLALVAFFVTMINGAGILGNMGGFSGGGFGGGYRGGGNDSFSGGGGGFGGGGASGDW